MLLEDLEHLIQILKRLGRGQVVFFQEVFTQDQAAVVERDIKEGGQVVALAVLQLQGIHIVLKTEFLDSGIEVRCPGLIIADGYDGTVERQGCILPLGGLIEDYIGCVGAGVEGQ